MGSTSWLTVTIGHLPRREAQAVALAFSSAVSSCVGRHAVSDQRRAPLSAKALYNELQFCAMASPAVDDTPCCCARCGVRLGGHWSDHVWPSNWPYAKNSVGQSVPVMRGPTTLPYCQQCLATYVKLITYSSALRKYCVSAPSILTLVEWKIAHRTKCLLAPVCLVVEMHNWTSDYVLTLTNAPDTISASTVRVQTLPNARLPILCRYAAVIAPKHRATFFKRNKSILRRIPWRLHWVEWLSGMVRLDSILLMHPSVAEPPFLRRIKWLRRAIPVPTAC